MSRFSFALSLLIFDDSFNPWKISGCGASCRFKLYNSEKRRKTENDSSRCFVWMYSDFSFKGDDKLLMDKFSSDNSKTCEEVTTGVNDTGKEFII